MPYDSLPAIDSAVVRSTLQRVISEASYRNHPALTYNMVIASAVIRPHRNLCVSLESDHAA